MRVVATISLDGTALTKIEGDCPFAGGTTGDRLEQKGLGLWLENWQHIKPEGKGARQSSRVFVPWTSCFYFETVAKAEEGDDTG